MLNGANRLADAVAVTLGPKGRNVVIEQSFGAPKVTKDGVTVAKAIEFKNKQDNLGAALIKQVASKTNDVAGDGTTTSTVLARAIFREGTKAVVAGMNPMDLKRGIDAAVKLVLEELENISKPISKPAEIQQVATISANGDAGIGKMVADAFERVGKQGTITVAEGKTLEHELEIVEGMKIDRGFISPYFITDTKAQKCVLSKPLVLIYDKKISSVQSILPMLEHAAKAQRPLLIIAEDVENEALATMIVNKLRGGLQLAAVKAPEFTGKGAGPCAWLSLRHGKLFKGRYTFSTSALLGEGRAARVYQGQDRSGKPVALKIYRDTSRMCLHCFRNGIEIRSLLQRGFPSPATVHDRLASPGLFVEFLGSTEAPVADVLYVVMELGAESLEDVLAMRYRNSLPFSIGELRDLHGSLVSVVYQLQRHGLVHLDIKPSNIVRFDKGGKPRWKLIDLDCISKQGVSTFGEVIFTPAYMAPELARAYAQAGPGQAQHCPVALKPSMDLWSAGICALESVLLFSAFTDKYLELRRSGSDHAFLNWLGNVEEPLLSQEVIDSLHKAHPDMHRFLTGMLEKDCSRRLAATDCLVHPWFAPQVAQATRTQRRQPSLPKSLPKSVPHGPHGYEGRARAAAPCTEPLASHLPSERPSELRAQSEGKELSSTCAVT
ncbi:unnamed protein product [Effrenium voratum]|uniref:Protein kinase domain-containing protein n=1 Tax=Effrenium voratum TaxID=2562239 RepID=A0AA36ITE4_9DINO|nr:unnamed protein product [Effrenium voratum]